MYQSDYFDSRSLLFGLKLLKDWFMRVFGMRKKAAAFLVAGVVLGACGGSGDSSSDSTVVAGRVKNSALGSRNLNWKAPCNEGGSCKLGDKGPGGGIVFYVGTNPMNVVDGVSQGGIYMEFLDLSTEFGSGAGQKPKPEWGCRRTSIASTQAPIVNSVLTDSVGKGAQNTKDIVAACATAGIPADVALNLDRNGQSDWFLPSFGELNQVCWFLRGQVKGNTELCSPDVPVVRTDITTKRLEDVRYWTSTEGNGEYASTYSFNATSKDGKLTLFTGGVRKDVTYPDIGVVRSFGQLPPECWQGGPCKVGDGGPGGGVVFFVADRVINSYGSRYPGGRYLEFVDANPTRKSWWPQPCSPPALISPNGSNGAVNTGAFSGTCSPADNPLNTARQSNHHGKSDWFIPSVGEMQLLMLFSRGQATDGSEKVDATRPSILGPRYTETFWTSTPMGKQFFFPYSMTQGKAITPTKTAKYGFLFVRAFGE
jgi:hypothetical protein